METYEIVLYFGIPLLLSILFFIGGVQKQRETGMTLLEHIGNNLKNKTNLSVVVGLSIISLFFYFLLKSESSGGMEFIIGSFLLPFIVGCLMS